MEKYFNQCSPNRSGTYTGFDDVKHILAIPVLVYARSTFLTLAFVALLIAILGNYCTVSSKQIVLVNLGTIQKSEWSRITSVGVRRPCR